MLELIIALFLSFGIISDPSDINDNLIQDHQEKIEFHIIEDDFEVG